MLSHIHESVTSQQLWGVTLGCVIRDLIERNSYFLCCFSSFGVFFFFSIVPINFLHWDFSQTNKLWDEWQHYNLKFLNTIFFFQIRVNVKCLLRGNELCMHAMKHFKWCNPKTWKYWIIMIDYIYKVQYFESLFLQIIFAIKLPEDVGSVLHRSSLLSYFSLFSFPW